MGERKSKEELEKLCKKYKVPFMWSWSRYNQYKTDKYSYLLKYILHEPEDRKDSIYAVSGGYCHDIIEQYYNGLLTQEQMITEYEDSLFTMNVAEYKYDRNDEDKNEAIANKYESCIKHFFRNHIKPDGIKMLTEMFIPIRIADGIVFQGYIDNCGIVTDENGKKKIVITDYKTSTIYKGEKLEKESGQLYLYAEGIRQKTKLPFSDIQIRYLFLKYVNVKCQMANGNWKERQIERNQIGAKLVSNVKMWLKKLGYDESIADDVVEYNSLDMLPLDVQDKFVIEDCYVYLPLQEDIVDNLKRDIIDVVTEINTKVEEYERTKDDHIFWSDVTPKNEYYLGVLSGYSRAKHKPYDEYLQEQEMYRTEDDDTDELLSMLEEI